MIVLSNRKPLLERLQQEMQSLEVIAVERLAELHRHATNGCAVTLLDLHMPADLVVSAGRVLHKEYPEVQIILLVPVERQAVQLALMLAADLRAASVVEPLDFAELQRTTIGLSLTTIENTLLADVSAGMPAPVVSVLLLAVNAASEAHTVRGAVGPQQAQQWKRVLRRHTRLTPKTLFAWLRLLWVLQLKELGYRERSIAKVLRGDHTLITRLAKFTGIDEVQIRHLTYDSALAELRLRLVTTANLLPPTLR